MCGRPKILERYVLVPDAEDEGEVAKRGSSDETAAAVRWGCGEGASVAGDFSDNGADAVEAPAEVEGPVVAVADSADFSLGSSVVFS